MDPMIRAMEQRLQAHDATRERAREFELQNELSLMRAEAQRHAETARVLAQASANLTSIPNEIRALREATAPQRVNVDVTSHLRDAQEQLARQAQSNHETNLQFLQRHAQDLAQFTGQVGGGIVQALSNFKPPEREQIIITQTPPPPPPPGGGRAKAAAKRAIVPWRGGETPPSMPAPASVQPELNQIVKAAKKTVAPPKPQPAPPAPPGSMPGSSQDHARHGGYGPAPAPEERGKGPYGTVPIQRMDKKPMDKKPQRFFIGDDEDIYLPHAAGVSQSTMAKHDEKLTKHGPKPVLAKTKKEKPEGGRSAQNKRKEMSYPAEARGVGRKTPAPVSLPQKRKAETQGKGRRVSAHQV